MTLHSKPRHASIAILDRCDAKCLMCNIWQNHRRDEVDISYFATLPTSLRSMNLTGGEPFLREDIVEVVRVISQRCNKPRIIISTNGFKTKKITEKMEGILKVNDRVGVRISVDGTGETHDKVRGVPGAFGRCMETLAALQSIGVKNLGLSFTLSPINLSSLTSVYHLAREWGIQFTLTIAQNSEFYFKTDQNNFTLDKKKMTEQFNELVCAELKGLHPKRWFRAYYDKGVYEYGLGRRVLKNCRAGSYFFFASARGEIYPCPILNEKMGEARDGSFEKVWASPRAEEVRRMAEDCPQKCWMTCTVKPHFNQNIASILSWIVRNKIKAHLGYPILS